MESKNIYDILFDVYENNTKETVSQLQIEFENELDTLLNNDCKETMYQLHNLLQVVGKEYYIAGMKMALGLFKY